ncbi:MAG: hypothetical protein ACXWF0_02030 [Usitatibacter sp.]
MNRWNFIGLFLVAVGGAYLRWPDMFRRGTWLKTSVAIRTMSPERYTRYMRGLGVLMIVLGFIAIVYGAVAR